VLKTKEESKTMASEIPISDTFDSMQSIYEEAQTSKKKRGRPKKKQSGLHKEMIQAK
jgi:hypothetical protein